MGNRFPLIPESLRVAHLRWLPRFSRSWDLPRITLWVNQPHTWSNTAKDMGQHRVGATLEAGVTGDSQHPGSTVYQAPRSCLRSGKAFAPPKKFWAHLLGLPTGGSRQQAPQQQHFFIVIVKGNSRPIFKLAWFVVMRLRRRNIFIAPPKAQYIYLKV